MKKILFLKTILIFSIVSTICYAQEDSETNLRMAIFEKQLHRYLSPNNNYEILILPRLLIATGDVNAVYKGAITHDAFRQIADHGRDFVNDNSYSAIMEKGTINIAHDVLPGPTKALATTLDTMRQLENKALTNLFQTRDMGKTNAQLLEVRGSMRKVASEIAKELYTWATSSQENLQKYNQVCNKLGLPPIYPDQDLKQLIADETSNADVMKGVNDALVGINDLIKQGKSVKEAIEESKGKSSKELSSALQKLVDANEQAKKKETDDAKMLADEERYQFFIREAQGALTSVAFLVGLENPKVANIVSATGGAVLKIYDSLHKFNSDPKKFGAFMLTGDIFSAISGIMSVFQPDPAAKRHDEVMKALATISTQIEDAKKEILKQLGVIEKNTETILDRLANIIKTLEERATESRYEFNIVLDRLQNIENMIFKVSILNDDDMNLFNRKLNEAFHKVAVAGQTPYINAKTFDAATLAKYATNFAYHAKTISMKENITGALLSSHLIDDRSIADALQNLPPQYLYNYLSEATKKLTTIGRGDPAIPNPKEWVRGAMAYATLHILHPKYEINQSELEEIKLGGEAIQSTIQGWRDPTLLPAIFSEYERVMKTIWQKAKEVTETSFETRLANKNKSWLETFTPPTTDDGLVLFPPPLGGTAGLPLFRIGSANSISDDDMVLYSLALDLIKIKGYWKIFDIKEVETAHAPYKTKIIPPGRGVLGGESIEFYKRKYSYNIECGLEFIRKSDDVPMGKVVFKTTDLLTTDWLKQDQDVANHIRESWKNPQHDLRKRFQAHMKSNRDYDLKLLFNMLKDYVIEDKNQHKSNVISLFNSPGEELYKLEDRLSALQLLLDGYLRLAFTTEFGGDRITYLLPSGEDVLNIISQSSYEDWKDFLKLPSKPDGVVTWNDNFFISLGLKQFREKMNHLMFTYNPYLLVSVITGTYTPAPTIPTIPAVEDALLLLKTL